MVSGGFSIIHIGHVRLIKAAAEYGKVIVALNSDEWLARKQGSPQVPWIERAEVLMALRHVAGVFKVEASDGTVLFRDNGYIVRNKERYEFKTTAIIPQQQDLEDLNGS